MTERDESDLCACGEVASVRVDVTLAGDATKTRGLCGECALSLGVMLDNIETQLLPPLKAIDHAASVVEPWRQLKARQRDRTALAVLRPGECTECKGTGEDWSNAAPTPCEACRGSTCGVVCDLVKNENCLQMAREDDREDDRDALAEARELLGNIPDSVVQIKHLYPRWHRAIVAFLKRTEPTDD